MLRRRLAFSPIRVVRTKAPPATNGRARIIIATGTIADKRDSTSALP